MRGLIASEGMSVLWATHLTDEVEDGDEVLVLHKGVLRASSSVVELLKSTGAADLKSAFVALTNEPAKGDAA